MPGNVRELRNAVERLLLLADTEVDEEAVRSALPAGARKPAASGTRAARVEQFERGAIRAELEAARNNMTEAARALGLERSHLYKKCAQLAIDLKQLRRAED
jgi:DNA-binding NtrC family response regulator